MRLAIAATAYAAIVSTFAVGMLFAVSSAQTGPQAGVGATPVPQAAWSQLPTGEMRMNFGFGLMNKTVAQLPGCSANYKGFMAMATDINAAPAYLANVTTGSGVAQAPVFCDGTNWKAF